MTDAAFLQAVELVLLDPVVWVVIIASAFYGVFMGATPGLSATMAVALLVPVVYFMDPVPAFAALVTLTAAAIFAGDIPAALLRIPGTPASAAFTDDAYGLTRRGDGERVLAVCLMGSAVGGMFGTILLILFAPLLADVAARTFSVIEYFWLYLIGLSCAVVVSRDSMLRGLLGLVVGLLLGSIGLSAVHAEARLTFGRPELYQGVNFIPAMIGLFGASEILRSLFAPALVDERPVETPAQSGVAGGRFSRLAALAGGQGLTRGTSFLVGRPWHLLRSSTVGSLIGMLPGAGADIASWVSVAVSKRFSKKPEDYGRQSMEGVADGATAKNAALAGAWIPALVFAIPGDSITAIVIGVLLMKDITPGPDIFTRQAPILYSIYLLFVIANLVLIIAGIAAIRTAGLIQRVPRRVLLPLVLLFCITGAYSINGSYFDVAVMGLMGLLGFALERRDVPTGPVVLGILLGVPLEERFIQTLSSSEGNFLVFFSRPVAAGLGLLAIALWSAPVVLWARRRFRHEKREEATRV